MKGGRYTTTFEVVGPAGIGITNYPSIACEWDRGNPLNPPVNTYTAPAPQTGLPAPGVSSMGPAGLGRDIVTGGGKNKTRRARKTRRRI